MPRAVLQDLNHGETWLEEVVRPNPGPAGVVIATRASIVSPGTERMLAEFGRAGLIGKVRSQPQRVAEVIDKALTDGVASTARAVRSKLTEPVGLGYSSSGIVVEAGEQVEGIEIGDLVAAAGRHADLARVPANLAAKVPEGVTAEDAAFATLASVALQGLRLAAPAVGERFVVTGLGLVGLLATQLLTAQGCQVLGIDPDPERRARAESYGALGAAPDQDVLAAAAQLSEGRGVDGVLICATTTSSEPVHQAAQMCRQRGRIVLVGVTGLELRRSDFYEKELSFQVSASYGPGRYDPTYEERGVDYPFGLVRWTAARNMEAVLTLIGARRLEVGELVTHRFDFDDAPRAYEALTTDPSALGILLRYREPDLGPDSPLLRDRIEMPATATTPSRGGIGLLGSGSFATRVLLPAIRAADASIHTVVSSGGTSAVLAARRFGAEHASSDPSSVLDDPAVETIFIATRHDSHASYVEQALRAGKHVFVEKPLAITTEELESLRACVEELAASGSLPLLGIGYNRRFAPVTLRMRQLLSRLTAPKALTLTMNAGALPAEHWTQDPAIGGGRIVGEACHLIDLARHLVGAPISEVRSNVLGHSPTRDSAAISLAFEDGSIAAVNYLANGSKRYPKERIEVFCGGRVLVNHNFRSLRSYGWPLGPKRTMLRDRSRLSQDKGHRACVAAFLEAVREGGDPPIPIDEIFEVARATLVAAGLE